MPYFKTTFYFFMDFDKCFAIKLARSGYIILVGTRGLRPHHPWCYPILSILGCGRGQNFFKTISECSTGLYLSIATSHDIIQQIWKNAIFSILGCGQTRGRGWKFLKSISERSPGLYLSIDTHTTSSNNFQKILFLDFRAWPWAWSRPKTF